MSARKLVKASQLIAEANGETGGSRTFVKLGELTPAQEEKGYYSLLAIGGTLAGVLKGTEIDLYKKTNYIIETAEGVETVIANAGNLGYQMGAVKPGMYVEITYNGKKEIKSGAYKGKESHNFEVLTERI